MWCRAPDGLGVARLRPDGAGPTARMRRARGSHVAWGRAGWRPGVWARRGGSGSADCVEESREQREGRDER
jgi:hypothetical protein